MRHTSTLTVLTFLAMLGVTTAVAACPAPSDESNGPGPADGGETGSSAAPDVETEALKARLVEAEKARMSCEAELAECKATPEQ